MQAKYADRSRSQTKFLAKAGFKPDSGVVTALGSIKQNPKFSRLLTFSLNCLGPLLTPPNPRHRDNVNYVIKETGHLNVIKALKDHIKDDNIIFHSTVVLIKLVGGEKWRDEEIAKILVDNGAVENLMEALNHPSPKSKHTIKAIIELINLLSTSPTLAEKIIGQNVLEGTVKVLKTNDNLSEGTVKTALEALQRVTSHPQVKNALISRKMVPEIISLLEKKSKSPVVAQSGLKLFSTLSQTKEGVEYLRQNGTGMKQIVKIMEQHPNEKAVLNIGSSVLAKIATVEDLESALKSLKTGDLAKNEFNVALISQLVLVDEMMDQVIRKGAVADLIGLIEKSIKTGSLKGEDKGKVIKHCAVAIGRVAEIDPKQVQTVIQHGGIETLKAALALKEPEAIESCINTLEKLCKSSEVLGKIAESGCIKEAMIAAKEFANNESVCAATISLISRAASEEDALNLVVSQGGLDAVIKMMKTHPENKQIIEQGTRALALMATSEENAQKMLDEGIIDFICGITKKHPQWRKFALYAVNLMDTLTLMEAVVPALCKAGGVETVVSLISGKSYDVSQFLEKSEKDEEMSEEQAKYAEEGEGKLETETLSASQEFELTEVALNVLKQLVNPEEIAHRKANLQKAIVDLEKSPNLKTACELEGQISTLGYLSLIEGLDVPILEQEVAMPLVEFSKKVTGLKEFEGKGSLVSAMVKFFSNLGSLSSKENTKDIYKGKKHENNAESNQVVQSLKALKGIIGQKVGEIQQKGRRSRVSLLEMSRDKGGGKMIEKLIEGALSNMKKYSDNEEVQLRALELFNTMGQLSPELNQAIAKLGGSRYVISKLEEDMTTKKVGTSCLKFLSNMGDVSKDTLLLMNNQKAVPAILSFLSNQKNDEDVCAAAQPLMKQLASLENSDFSKNIESDIQDLIATLDPQIAKPFERTNAVEAIELLGNFALLEKSIDPIMKSDAIASIKNLLDHELSQEEGKLAEAGQLTMHDRLIGSSFKLTNNLLASPQALKANIYGKLAQNDLINSTVDVLATKGNFLETYKQALLTANNLLNNSSTKEALVIRCKEKKIPEILTKMLDSSREDPELSSAAQKLLFGLAKESPEIIQEDQAQSIIKNLVKENKSELKLVGDSKESTETLIQSIQCLNALAEQKTLGDKIVSEGGIEFSLAVIKKGNIGVEIEEAEATALDLRTDEQKLQKAEIGVLGEEGQVAQKDKLQSTAMSLLNKLAKNPEEAKKIGEDGIIELIKSLSKSADDRDALITNLSVLEKACQNEKLLNVARENKAVEAVFAVNKSALDPEIERTSGAVLGLLGCGEFAKQIISRLDQDFNKKDIKLNEEQLDVLAQLHTTLATCMTAPTGDEDEAAKQNETIVKELENVLPSCIKNVEEKPEALGASALLIARLCRQGEPTRALLRNSNIPKILLKDCVANPQVMSGSKGKLPELVLSALSEMLGNKEEFLGRIDSEKGKDVVFDLKEIAQPITSILLENDGELLEELGNLIDVKSSSGESLVPLSCSQKAGELCAKVCEADPEIAKQMTSQGTVGKLKNLWENMNRNAQKDGPSRPNVGKLANVFGAFGKTQEGFDKVTRETGVIKKINDSLNSTPINVDTVVKRAELANIKSGLACFEALADNNCDKTELGEQKVPECCIDTARRFNALPVESLIENEGLQDVVKKNYEAIKQMAKDPMLSRVLGKAECADVLVEGVIRAGEVYKPNEKNISKIAKNDSPDCLGSAESLDRMVEAKIAAMEEFTTSSKNAEKIALLDNKKLCDSLCDIMEKKADDPLLMTKCAKFIENSVNPLEKDYVKTKLEVLKPLAEDVSKLAEIYPNIIALQDANKNIQLVLSGKEAEVEEKKDLQPEPEAELNPVEVLGNLDLFAENLENFVDKAKKGGPIDKKEEMKVAQFVKSVKEIKENALQIHNLGVTEGLVGIVESKNLSKELREDALESLADLFAVDESVVEKFAEDPKISETIVGEISHPDSDKIAIKALEIAGNLASNEKTLDELIAQGGVKSIVDLINKNEEKPELIVPAVESLSKITVDDDVASEIADLGGVDMINKLYKKFPDLLKLLRAFALLVGKLAMNEQVQTQMGQNGTLDNLIKGLGKFPEDVPLGEFSAFALANLCHNHEKNAEIIMKSDAHIAKNAKEPKLIANTCQLFNSCSYKNLPNKKELGQRGIMDELTSIFNVYIKEDLTQKENCATLKMCFKAIGNISLYFDNTTLLIKSGFPKYSCDFISSTLNLLKDNKDVADLIKFALDIISNMASFPEEGNAKNIEELNKQGVIDTLINSVSSNELNTDILLSGVTAIDYLCRNKTIRAIFAEKKGIEVILTILKSQDWNKDIVTKCLRILSYLSSLKENVDLLIQNKVHTTMIDIVQVQKDSDKIALLALKILAKICIDKPKCKDVYQAGFVEAVFAVYEEGVMSLESIIEMFGIMSMLSKYCEEASELIGQKGGHLILNTIQTQMKELKLLKIGMLLLEAMLNTEQNVDIITQNKGIEGIVDILTKNINQDDVLISGFHCLVEIAKCSEEYRKMCVDLNCVDSIKTIIEMPATKPTVVTEGKLAIQVITALSEIPPEEKIPEKQPGKELITKEIRNFLVSGKIIKLYKKDGSSKEMHMFLTNDLREIMAKRPKREGIKQQWRLPIHQIKDFRYDYLENKNSFNQSCFAKSKGLFKKKPDPELCFSLLGPLSLEGQRMLHIKCTNLIEKKKWVECLSAVLEDYKRTIRKKA